MERYLSLLQIARYVGNQDLMNVEQKLKLADRLLRCYHRCELFNNSKRSSEIMYDNCINYVSVFLFLIFSIF